MHKTILINFGKNAKVTKSVAYAKNVNMVELM